MADYTTTTDSIVLGDGELYLCLASEAEGKTEDLLVPALKMVGAIDSGASVEYKPKYDTIKAINRPKFYYKTDEDATFKSGTMNFSSDNVAFVTPSTLTTDGTTQVKTLTIGGKNSAPVVYLRFVHTEADGSQIIVNMTKCQCINGTSFTFNEKPVVLDMEFASLTGMSDAGCLEIKFVPATV